MEWEHIREFPDGQRFHIIAYRAYDAYGLVGSEDNGVAVVRLPIDKRCRGGDVVAARMGCSSSGWSGLTQAQLDMAYDLAVCSWPTFRQLVNSAHERRFEI